MTTAAQHPVRHVDIHHAALRPDDAVEPAATTRLRLAYREAGDPAAPVLLLLHALGESSLSWDPLLDDLAALGYRVLAPDARGHGESERPGQYSYELMTADTLAFCAALDITAPGGLAIVGHSMGAVTAALVTTALNATPPAAEADTTRPAASQPATTEATTAPVTRLVLEDAAPPRPGGPRFEPFDEPDHPVPFDWPLVNALRAQRGDPDPAWWDDALGIEAPVLVVAGGPTSNVDQADLAELADGVAHGRLVEIRVGHMVHDEAPDEFLAVVTDFLRR
ncbi:alpha/beta fold hydrolase [Promicromonospora kroppenstedtii]|uniref:alpha/beta fold hydrolase n=1 Tax=Promicromonospora kroppenstedtii TaxID=440482 RepID=UPI0004B5306C|nr:alpha/beta fold hydrolase [Promicromonospora kroppenstedtii]